MDYKTKYALQQQVIKDNFAHFDVPYNGADNNDYVDGKGFAERDGSLKGAMLKAASLKDNFQQGDSYEQYQYFYHPDHLGSSSFITNTEGEVVQHIEYVPYGEVFIEERNFVQVFVFKIQKRHYINLKLSYNTTKFFCETNAA